MSENNQPVFTAEQQAAVQAPAQGVGKILAGAGSGKTEVLTSRIRHLLRHGIAPDRLVAITYTNKAASALKNRLIDKGKVSARVVQLLQVSTFHSFLAGCIKDDPFAAQIAPGHRILTQNDQQLFLSHLTDWFRATFAAGLFDPETGMGPLMTEPILQALPELLRQARRYLLSPREFYRRTVLAWKARQRAPSRFEQNVATWFYRFYSRYVQALREETLLDFDEILFRGRRLLLDYREHGLPLTRDHFLIDEFQDNNPEQLGLIKLFAISPAFHLTVVGDPGQSIYRFQGADVATFTALQADQEYPLSRNFRSYEEILTLADSYAGIGQTSPRRLSSARGPSPRPLPVACFIADDRSGIGEVGMMAEMIQGMVASGLEVKKTGKPVSYGDIALIVSSIRTLGAIKALEDELAARNIPYVLSGGLGFYDLSEIHELLAFFRLLENPRLDHALLKILTGPVFGLADSETAALAQAGRHEKMHLLPHLLASPADRLPARALRFRDFFLKFQNLSGGVDLLDLTYRLLDEGGYREFAAGRENLLRRRRLEANFGKFIGIVRQFQANAVFSSIPDFLAYVDYLLKSDISEDAADLGLEESGAVRIMTIHKAKGLEFPVVFLPFLKSRPFVRRGEIFFDRSEGLLLNRDGEGKKIDDESMQRFHAREKAAHEEEERRKFYVAATRAEELLILSGFPGWRGGNQVLDEFGDILRQYPNVGQVRPLAEFRPVLQEWLNHGTLPPEQKTEVSEQACDRSRLAEQIKAVTQAARPTATERQKSPALRTVFSLQELNTYELCPRLFHLRSSSAVPMEERRESPARDLGQLVHRSILAWHEYGYHGLSGRDRDEQISRLVMLIGGLQDSGDETVLTRARRILTGYFDHPLGRKKPDLLEAEVHVRFDDPEGAFYLRGFSDRVDLDADGVRIFDFKVHRYSPEAHASYSHQLALYQVAAVRGVLGERGALNFPEAAILYLTERGVEAVPSEADLAAFEQWAGNLVSRLRQDREWLPRPGEPCRNCAFAVLCPGGRESGLMSHQTHEDHKEPKDQGTGGLTRRREDAEREPEKTG